MKLRILGAALNMLLAAPAFSQTTMSADIPFRFHVGGASLAAGQYRLSWANRDARAWCIRAADGKPGALFTSPIGVEAKKAPERGALVFHGYGNTYFLSQVRVAGQTTGWQLMPSKAEREYVKARRPVETAAVSLTTERPR